MNEADVAGAQPLSQLLRMAVMAGVESAVRIHIERGDDLNARDANGMTPLMLSAARNKPAICKLLLNAGVDHGLLDPSGKTAMDIAVANGSEAVAELLGAVRTSISPLPPFRIPLHPESGWAAEFSAPLGPVDAETTPKEPDDPTVRHELDTPPEPPALRTASPSPATVDDLKDGGEFDLSAWESEGEPKRPEVDLTVLDSASAIQTTITAHAPIDSSAEWEDIDVYLPEIALPLARVDDAEGRARLRRLLLRALREGSVPGLEVQDQTVNEDRSANRGAEAYLAMIINDLGAEVDERFEYSDADESYEVFVDPAETPDEEAALDEALDAIDSAASPRNEPLRIYQREFQRLRLLTAEEEIQLGKDMEAALDAALHALATWPEGITRTLAAGAAVIEGSRQISSMWIGGVEPNSEPNTIEGLSEEEPGAEHSEDTRSKDSEPAGQTRANVDSIVFAEALQQLASLVDRDATRKASLQEVRLALADLRLNRGFLLELTDTAKGLAPCPEFVRAMSDFRKARDRMATANLKLAFFHAKKYLYSGEPLDDLAQEGNIGLLKAVDRYDWRRGFRFSTYATWWIRQQIGRYVADKARTIRIPVHVHEKMQRMKRLAQAFEATADRAPTVDELAERMEMTPHQLAKLLCIAPETSRIDELPIDDVIAIDARDEYSSPDPADVVEALQLSRAVDRFISSLSTRDRREERVLRMRFGIGVSEELTLEDVGKRFKVTRERIRQIETSAIRRLKHPARSEPFARLVLGLKPEERHVTSSAPGSADDMEGIDAGEKVPLRAIPEQPAAPQPPKESIRLADPSKPSKLDRLFAQAAELGIRVEDDRLRSGHIWVRLPETLGMGHRKLVRQLLDSGFALWPGKGYWR